MRTARPLHAAAVRLLMAAASLMLASPAAWAAGNCDEIRQRIDAKICAGGVSQFSLVVVDAAASAPGRVVGSCDLGSKRIVYQADGTPPRAKDTPILTECKDGSVTMGGDCRR